MDQTRGLKKTLVGTVTSVKMDKTIVVKVGRRYKHEKYGKYLTNYKKYYAHDENNQANEGDEVMIYACRPYSKTKRWRMEKITRKVIGL